MDDFLQQSWRYDVNGDCTLAEYNFTRRPLVVEGEACVEGQWRPVVFITMHTKSKFINGGKRLWTGTAAERQEFIQKAVKNRRRIAGECLRLRKALDRLVYSEDDTPLIVVSGDMNDGPGMDFFEEFYLLGDSVDQLLGSPFYQKRVLESLLVRSRWMPPSQQWSCEFDDYIDNIDNKRVLLDHICVSKGLSTRVVRAKVAHDEYNQAVTGPEKHRGDRPSDHRPVFVDVALGRSPATETLHS
mmetsp:Transcript_6683/g.14751  ORF Transcript_6683/g.14751 Transcript_6683/m.14751 type:complete len:243 (-) Transcript_6683:715-1443(-)